MAGAAEVEHALFLADIAGTDFPASCRRLYFGAEFCPWAMPAEQDCLAALQLAHAHSLAFTLATPVLNETWLPRLERLCRSLATAFGADDEILISDWGALEIVRACLPTTSVILGRALSGQKRGPRILELDLTSQQRDYFRGGSWQSPPAAALLAQESISRVELDNLLQGVKSLPAELSGSLHYPWIMVASSRNCPFHDPAQGRGCDQSCGEAFTLTTPETRLPLVQAGNTQYLKHAILPENPAALGIDRLVEHRAMPR